MKESDVAQYLSDNPSFFKRHLGVLESLSIPHPVNGDAISLLERQVMLLRKTASDHQSEFQRLVAVARENESIMLKSRRLILAGLESDSLDEFLSLMDDILRNEFDILFNNFILFSNEPHSSNVRISSVDDAEPVLKEILLRSGCYSGVLSVAESHYLFGDVSDKVMSAAVLPLVSRINGDVRYLGVLALGSSSLEKFSKDKGDLFLSYLSELLSAILLRLIK
ncbi:DUF484 family protein [Marinomonas algicola]|uniref:DUF484 family protein n=1 Tax=Marinomonas algicola TaxID=2773454 RepID=UPI00174DCBA3|nr:DUF484 family protein [Marinomonas algicola]